MATVVASLARPGARTSTEEAGAEPSVGTGAEAAAPAEGAGPGEDEGDGAEMALVRPKDFEVDEAFFETGRDGLAYVFESLPGGGRGSTVPVDWLEEQEAVLDAGLARIQRVLDARLKESYDSFVSGMQRVREVETDLQFAGVICSNGRRNLGAARDNLTTSGLAVSSAVECKATATAVLDLLSVLSSLEQAPAAIDAQLELGAFADAVTLADEVLAALDAAEARVAEADKVDEEEDENGKCDEVADDSPVEDQAAREPPTLVCASHLRAQVTNARNAAVVSMGDAIREAFVSFDAERYGAVLSGYAAAGKEVSVKTLGSIVVDAVRLATRNVVLSVVARDGKVSSKKMRMYRTKFKFKELAALVPEDAFVETLRELAACGCDLLYNYSAVESWHRAAAAAAADASELPPEMPLIVGVGAMLRELRSDKLWASLERYVVSFVSVANVALLPPSAVFGTLELATGLAVIGDEYSETKCGSLRAATRAFATTYFETAHAKALDHLKTILENDTWQRWPVHASYGVADLKFVRPRQSVLARPVTATASTGGRLSLTERFAMEGNPFRALAPPVDEAASVVASGDAGGRGEVAAGERGGPLVGSATISLLRALAEYTHLLPALQACSGEVLNGMEELLLFYVFSVFKLFGLRGQDLVRELTLDPRTAGGAASESGAGAGESGSGASASGGNAGGNGTGSGGSNSAGDGSGVLGVGSSGSGGKGSKGGKGKMPKSSSSNSLTGLLARAVASGSGSSPESETTRVLALVRADSAVDAGLEAFVVRGLGLLPLESLPSLCSIVNLGSPTTLYGSGRRWRSLWTSSCAGQWPRFTRRAWRSSTRCASTCTPTWGRGLSTSARRGKRSTRSTLVRKKWAWSTTDMSTC